MPVAQAHSALTVEPDRGISLHSSDISEPSSTAELEARLAALEAENARLRKAESARLDEPLVAAPLRKRRFSARAVGSAVTITIAALLIPLAIVSSWARLQLTDENAFVATFAPLAQEPAVRVAVVEASMAIIEEQIDIDQTTNELFDGIEQLGLPERASHALDLLRQPAANGARALMHDAISDFVASDLFADSWRTALAYSHRALIATATAGSGADDTIVIDATGDVRIQLGPVISELTQHLAANGFPMAKSIPAVSASIVVAHAEALTLVGVVYSITKAVGWWIPFTGLALIAAGIALARHRRTALIGAGAGTLLGSLATLILMAIGSAATAAFASQASISPAAAIAIYSHLTGGMQSSASDLVTISIILLALSIMTGSHALRGMMSNVNSAVRKSLGLERLSPPDWQQKMRRYRVATRAVLVALTALLIIVLPVHVASIVLLSTISLLVWWALALLEAPSDAKSGAHLAESSSPSS